MRKNAAKGFSRVRAGFFLVVMGLAAMSVTSGRLWAKVDVSFRISGSYGQLMDGAGDVEKTRKGYESYFFDLNQFDNYTTTFDWKKPIKTNDFRAELTFRITRNFALSIGSGYLCAKNAGSYTTDYSYAEGFEDVYLYEAKDYAGYSQNGTLSAIPITLDAYLFLPIGKKETFTVFAHIGAGYYFGSLRFNLDTDRVLDILETTYGELSYRRESTYDIRMTENIHSNSFGFQAGLGFDIKLTPTISIGAEAYGREVVFRNWIGSSVTKSDSWSKSWSFWMGDNNNSYSDTDSTYGNLWTYEAGCSDEGNRYTTMWVLDEKPEGSCYHSVRKSSINLNSYGVSVSLNLHFKLF